MNAFSTFQLCDTKKNNKTDCSRDAKDFTLANQKIVNDLYPKKQFDDFLTPLLIHDELCHEIFQNSQEGTAKNSSKRVQEGINGIANIKGSTNMDKLEQD